LYQSIEDFKCVEINLHLKKNVIVLCNVVKRSHFVQEIHHHFLVMKDDLREFVRMETVMN
jgi:hypothetical protein